MKKNIFIKLSIFFSFSTFFNRVNPDLKNSIFSPPFYLFIVLLQRGQILSRLTELSLFHPFTHIPMNERPLGVHEIEFVVEACPGFGDGSSVGEHANSARYFG